MSMSRARTRKRARMTVVFAGLAMLGVSVALALLAFEDNIVFFYGPTEIVEQGVEPGQNFRLGGLVKEDSVGLANDGVTNLFIVTDNNANVEVAFKGILPDLFREGQGIVALGALNNEGRFIASEVLAKHDENYMPPEAVEAMKRAGTWKHTQEEGN
ncbi:cytochrome c maturation protein CcmE [Curvivirga aplysinae]|uniref:cytochrome c maturation protein CcmE n=1 Tax=Curvivirga aplysinae TaxID=2529852 RepID=UPI0012BB4A1F|nr:cytochrome c maturation protein CcmE [Curvivirga aplysinae]MTI08506.1 cytochrome c maturation protein CcmE [Curvivirga aplysinae]